MVECKRRIAFGRFQGGPWWRSKVVARPPVRTSCTVPNIPITANELFVANWGKRYRLAKLWKLIVRLEMGRRDQPPASRCVVRIRITRGQRQDPDNFKTSLKPILDALTHNRQIRDDSHKWIDLDAVEIGRRGKANWQTEITVETIPGTAPAALKKEAKA